MIQKVLRLTAYWLRLRQCLAYQTVTFDYAKPPGVKRKTKPYVHYYAGYSVYVLRMTGKFSHWVEHVQPNFDYWKPIYIQRWIFSGSTSKVKLTAHSSTSNPITRILPDNSIINWLCSPSSLPSRTTNDPKYLTSRILDRISTQCHTQTTASMYILLSSQT